MAHRAVRSRSVVQVHVRGAVDDSHLLRTRRLRVKLVAVPKRTGLAARDDLSGN